MARDFGGGEGGLIAFHTFKESLASSVVGPSLEGLFSSLELAYWDHDEVVLTTENPNAADILSHQLSDFIRQAWESHFGPVSRLKVTRQGAQNILTLKCTQTNAPERNNMAKPMRQRHIEDQHEPAGLSSVPKADRGTDPIAPVVLNIGKTLERFCVNDTNRVARHAVMRLLEGAATPVTYIYSANGRGKTHLLNAVALEWLRRHPGGRLMFLHYDTLVADVSDACVTNRLKELKGHLLDADILILDDVHLLRGRKRTQEELGCLIDRMTQAGKIVLIAGAAAPSMLAVTGICNRLTDRLSGGVSVELKAPDYELRLRIANQWAADYHQRTGIEIPQRQLDLIARRCETSVRELEGFLFRFDLEMEAARGLIDDEAVRLMLTEAGSSVQRDASIENVFAYTLEVFGISRADMVGRRRQQALVRARHAFSIAARKIVNAPLAAIGAMLSRDHTTVMNSLKKAEILAEQDAAFADRLGKILERFEV